METKRRYEELITPWDVVRVRREWVLWYLQQHALGMPNKKLVVEPQPLQHTLFSALSRLLAESV